MLFVSRQKVACDEVKNLVNFEINILFYTCNDSFSLGDRVES